MLSPNTFCVQQQHLGWPWGQPGAECPLRPQGDLMMTSWRPHGDLVGTHVPALLRLWGAEQCQLCVVQAPLVYPLPCGRARTPPGSPAWPYLCCLVLLRHPIS